MLPLLEEFCRFYRSLDQNALSDLELIYHDDIEFCDPVHCVRGMEKFRHYFEELMQQVSYCRFEIHQVNSQLDEAFVRWTMRYRHPRLNGGEIIEVEGVSHLRYGEKIHYHRDYFDLGAMIYEQVPLIGRLIKGIKEKLGR